MMIIIIILIYYDYYYYDNNDDLYFIMIYIWNINYIYNNFIMIFTMIILITTMFPYVGNNNPN